MDDYYAVLGIDHNATIDEINSAFRKKAIFFHPDHNGDAELFKMLKTARDTLCNLNLRKEYDKQIASNQAKKSNSQESNSADKDYVNIFGCIINRYITSSPQIVSLNKEVNSLKEDYNKITNQFNHYIGINTQLATHIVAMTNEINLLTNEYANLYNQLIQVSRDIGTLKSTQGYSRVALDLKLDLIVNNLNAYIREVKNNLESKINSINSSGIAGTSKAREECDTILADIKKETTELQKRLDSKVKNEKIVIDCTKIDSINDEIDSLW